MATATIVQCSAVIPYTPSGAKSKGDIIVTVSRVGVAVRDIADSVAGELMVEGTALFPKTTGAIADGTRVFWNNSGPYISITSTDGIFLGTTVGASLSADTTQQVRLNAPSSASNAAVVATAFKQTIVMPAQLADFVNSGAWTIAVPFAFTVLSALWRTGKPASTSSKLATLTLSTSAGAVTGGVMALTTANQNTTGGTVAASAISGANATGAAAGTIIVTASAVTAFVEGDGWVEVTVSNNDLASPLF